MNEVAGMVAFYAAAIMVCVVVIIVTAAVSWFLGVKAVDLYYWLKGKFFKRKRRLVKWPAPDDFPADGMWKAKHEYNGLPADVKAVIKEAKGGIIPRLRPVYEPGEVVMSKEAAEAIRKKPCLLCPLVSPVEDYYSYGEIAEALSRHPNCRCFPKPEKASRFPDFAIINGKIQWGGKADKERWEVQSDLDMGKADTIGSMIIELEEKG